DSVQVWSVSGGNLPAPAQYQFQINEFKVTRGAGTLIDDTFSDGNAPPSAPNFGNGNPASYATSGTFVETGDHVLLDSSNAVPINGVGTSAPLIGNTATLLTDISSDQNLGLKKGNDFTVEGRFELIVPDDLREGYGIRLTDRTGNG